MVRTGSRAALASWNTIDTRLPRSGPHLLGVAEVDVDAADAEAPVVELAVRRQQPHHGEAERGLTGAGLADDGHAVPGGHGEVDAVEGVHDDEPAR